LPKSPLNKARKFNRIPTTTTVSRTLELIASSPIYQRVLELAIEHEQTEGRSNGYRGWQWHDVEIHPTKLIRLVTEGISRVNLKTRQATFYMLKNRAEVKKALAEITSITASESLEELSMARAVSKKPNEKAGSSPSLITSNGSRSGRDKERLVQPEASREKTRT
jgi:hypothetical protein